MKNRITKAQENEITKILRKHDLYLCKLKYNTKGGQYMLLNSQKDLDNYLTPGVYFELKIHSLHQKNKKDLYEILTMWEEHIPERLPGIKNYLNI